MATRAPNYSAANEDRFLGALLGLAIGDALGMPVEGLSRAEVAARFGELGGYEARTLPDDTEIAAGEFTDETEVALCVVEALTTSRGSLDVELVGARMRYLAGTESRRWLGAATLAALERAGETGEWEVPLDEDGPATGDVATRGVPIGLLHAVGRFDPNALRRDAERVTRLTHGSPAAIAATVAVAFGVNQAARAETPRPEWARATARFLGGGELAARLERADDLLASWSEVSAALAAPLSELGTGEAAAESVAAGFLTAGAAGRFEDGVFAAARAGGAAGTVGAIAGALVGAADGASGIPQGLIDGLGGRIYISLAAPWLYRAALQGAGLIIDLRPEGDAPPPRPTLPPRQ